MARSTPPSLNNLRVFESAARNRGFAKAALELHITPAAVSHRIKDLESALGVRLFDRKHRGVTLTESGRRYLGEIANAFELIERATANIHETPVAGPITVSLPESFAQFWMIPRLVSLKNRLPEIELTLEADSRLTGLKQAGVDIAVRFGIGSYPGLNVEYVCGDLVTVLGSADAISTHGHALTRHLIRQHSLLEDTRISPNEPWMGWQPWLREAGIVKRTEVHTIRFSDSGLALRACLSGAGLCISRISLAYDHLKNGELAAVMPWRSTEFAYHLVTRVADQGNPRTNAFKLWLISEMRRFSEDVRSTLGLELDVPGVRSL